MSRLKEPLLYPFVIATFPVVFFYAENTREGISIAEVAAAWGLVITITALILVSLRVVIRDSVKLSLIVSIMLVMFFAYGPVQDALLGRGRPAILGDIGEDRYLLSIFGILWLLVIGLVVRSRLNLRPLLQGAAVVAVLLVAFNLIRIGIDTVDNGSAKPEEALVTSGVNPLGYLPDIYYIILDSYGRDDVLRDLYDFDNHEFVDFLTTRGFYVASESRTNYARTHFSIGSTLNMRYLREGEDGSSQVKHNVVMPLAQNLGYQYYHVSSGHSFTKTSADADVLITLDNPLEVVLSDFMAGLLTHTIAYPIGQKVGVNLGVFFAASDLKYFNHSMKELKDIPNVAGPTIAFNHNLPPHGPFVFDRDGNLRPDSELVYDESAPENIGLYIDQVIYVNKVVGDTVDFILKQSTREPVIIIQGDHGPSQATNADMDNPDDLFIHERTGILNAYYLPEPCRSSLYPSISPVNSFRLVFACLGVNFPLLEDRTYWTVGEPAIDIPASHDRN